MLACNVDIFSPNEAYPEVKLHTTIKRPNYKIDYLTLASNTVTIENSNNVEKGDYIRLYDTEFEFFGVITDLELGLTDNTQMEVTYKPFTSLFDILVAFNTTQQGSSTNSLENAIAFLIRNEFILNSDTEQVIKILSQNVEETTQTYNFLFNIKPDKEGKPIAFINLYTTLIANAFNKYGVVVNPVFDATTRQIELKIGKNEETNKIIEAELPNILEKQIYIRRTKEDVNKLFALYGGTNPPSGLVQSRTFYKHTDGRVDEDGTRNRIKPVILTYKWFEGDTLAEANQNLRDLVSDTFEAIQYDNLIELTVANNDTLVDPKSIKIGDKVQVIYKGVSYASLLSGKEVNEETTKLIFGSIRLDLTKLIKTGGINNG